MTKIDHIKSYTELEENLKKSKMVYILIYKKGASESDCAYDHLVNSEISVKVLAVDVNEVRDIHNRFGIKTAPSLLEFSNGQFTRTIKGCHKPEVFESLLNEHKAVNSKAGSNLKEKNIILYSTPTCTYCTTIKSYFRKNNISYKEVDVSKDTKAAREMVRKSGKQGVPQTYINGNLVMGFDKPKLDELLEISK